MLLKWLWAGSEGRVNCDYYVLSRGGVAGKQFSLGGFSGLGVNMTRVRKLFNYDNMFTVIILISALSLELMKCVDLLECVCMPWKRTLQINRFTQYALGGRTRFGCRSSFLALQ